MAQSGFYATDLAYIHDAGFGDYASRAAPELVQLLCGHPPSPKASARRRAPLVVEFGCGGGTVARHLVQNGYKVLGIDQSPAMIRLARKHAPGAMFRVGSLARTRIPRCDAVVALGEVVSYIAGPKATTKTRRHEGDLFRFFRRAFRALTPGGVLVFDFIESAEGRTYDAKSRAGEDWAIVMRAKAKGRVLTRDITTARKVGREYRRSHETHRVRIYTRQAIAGPLRRTGFTVTMHRSIGRVRLIRGNVVALAQKQA